MIGNIYSQCAVTDPQRAAASLGCVLGSGALQVCETGLLKHSLPLGHSLRLATHFCLFPFRGLSVFEAIKLTVPV